MITDLVSPWSTALAHHARAAATGHFRRKHSVLLEALRRARTPSFDEFPLAAEGPPIAPLARRAADPATQQLLRDALSSAATLGADRCSGITLVAGDGSADCCEPLVAASGGEAVLFLEQGDDDRTLLIGLARAAAALCRWLDPSSQSAVRERARPGWSRWETTAHITLREWIYTEGLGIHLAHALLPAAEPHQLLGVARAGFDRLRQREKVFASLLAADLDHKGVGLTLRWLTPSAPSGPRTVAGVVLPPLAGRYLAWRMTAQRVDRVGLADALRMESD